MSSRRPGIEKKIAELSNAEKHVLRSFEKLIGDESKATKRSSVEMSFSEDDIAEASELPSLELVRSGLNYLVSKHIVKVLERVKRTYTLDKEGEYFALKGLPETRVLKALAKTLEEAREFGSFIKEGVVEKYEVPIAVGWLKRKGHAEIMKIDGKTCLKITAQGRADAGITGEDERFLLSLREGKRGLDELDDDEKRALSQLKSRKNVLKEKEHILRRYQLTEEGFAILEKGFTIKTTITRLTPDIIKKGEFQGVEFQPYDVKMYVPPLPVAKRHPVREIINEIREIFSNMGFTEIHGDVVVSSFWNMDALFIPQDHPAREMQDTFYLSRPGKMALDEEKDCGWFKTISNVHEHGGETGSTGWGRALDEEESRSTLLRTHTTVNTIRYLADNPEPPQKIFSIGRVFRKEAIDSTHLPEFHQVEGILLEENANFNMLIGILKDFYYQMGFREIRFRPGYFPYTEPSMEVEVKFEGKWLELGGSGIFRPEVGEPFGIKHPILAWGLGLERLVMLRLGLTNIRDLYISDIDWLR